MEERIKLPIGIAACIALIYIWAIFMQVIGFPQGLLFSYVLIGFILSSAFYVRKRPLKEYLVISIAFGLVAGVIDLSLTVISIPELVVYSLADVGAKSALSVLGGLLFFAVSRKYDSGRKFLMTDAGTLIRRIVAAIVDFNVILFIISILSFSVLMSAELAMNVYFIIAVETIAIFAYKTIFESVERKTIGKMVAGIEVRSSPARIAMRNLVFILFGISMLPEVMGTIYINLIYIVILADLLMFFSGKRLFDVLSSTKVVRSKESFPAQKKRIVLSFR